MTDTLAPSLPAIIAGPIVRRVTPRICTLWLVSTRPLTFRARLFSDNAEFFDGSVSDSSITQTQVGERAYVVLINIPVDTNMPHDALIHYDLRYVNSADDKEASITSIPALLYDGQEYPSFIIRHRLTDVLHGSCRKPHHDSVDGLVRVDQRLEAALCNNAPHPDLLIMSGDQVYVDDVAGPMLVAVHQTIALLGLFHEKLTGSVVEDSEALLSHPFCYYQRPQLLPADDTGETLYSKFFAAKKKPVFTSVNANNHLVSFAEVVAMYILTWSPTLWQQVTLDDSAIADEFKPQFAREKQVIEQFVETLPQVRRALAHLPVYMIFDDHDITDDWNLTRGWEDAIYNHPFARRIVGNALLGYWLCQGMGNAPETFAPLLEAIGSNFSAEGVTQHDEVIDALLEWDTWHYHLDTAPKLVVLDTRTHRWRSESSLSKPSGLMDWEALCELQQELIDQPSVILVSAAPIFGVKLIETVQKIFTFFGQALTVDAENWMAHRGTASVILNIFRHYKTPPRFIILSGDVHYSFVYDITLRFRRNSPHITQVTSSGIKNQFPATLLNWFDRLNRLLYARRSPLNWFTQRRRMSIRHRKPDKERFNTLLNASGIGELTLDKSSTRVTAKLLCADGRDVEFHKSTDADDHE